MKKHYTVFLLLLGLLSLSALYGNSDLSDLRGLTMSNAKIPIYNRSGKPQMMIFVNKAERRGRLISGKGTVLDFLRPTASVDDIKDAWRIKLYPLQAPFKEVFDFWLPRLKYSEAIVRTSQADIDQENHKASGSSAVFLRSPMLDLNGIGFEANFKRREIRINSDIEVLIRTAGSDPRKLSSLDEKKYRYITASGDSLLIELEEKRIMLIGSVTIHEAQAVITCDRLTVVLSRGKDSKKTAKKGKDFDLTTSGASGISQLLADGSVVVSGKDKNSGKIYADHLIYDLKERLITLTGDVSPESLSFRQLKDNVRTVGQESPEKIDGFVIVDSEQMRSFGRKVIVHLKKDSKNALQSGSMIGTGMTAGKADSAAGSLDKITYPDGVFICGKEKKNSAEAPFVASADYSEYLPQLDVINLRNNVLAGNGDNELSCDTAELKVSPRRKSGTTAKAGLESIHCRSNVRLVHREKQQTTGNLTSDKADFYLAEDRIVFHENVKADHGDSKLNCNQLELFLANRKNPAAQASDRKKSGQKINLQTAKTSSKTLQKAVATGDVVMTDPRATLNTGLLTLHFRELLPGEKAVQSMLQSGGVRLSSIICDNGLKVVSSSNPDAKSAAGFFGKSGSQGIKNLTAMRSETDLEKNISTFTGNVKINDDISSLECETINLYSAPRQAAAKANVSKKVDDPDADPFALVKTENYAPSQILIGENLELKKAECLDNVILKRKLDKRTLEAGGKRADYDVKAGKIIISGEEPDRAWIQADNRRQTSNKLIYHLAEERFESSGDTVTTNL
jgi:lipopolysaccharide export system protein LptA